MTSNDRLKRLRGLIDQLERLPASAERDLMLREVRARVVDVDTGVEPSALRPLVADESTLAADPPARVRRAPTRRRQPAKPLPVLPEREIARGGSSTGPGDRLTIPADELLSLDEGWPPPGGARTELAPAWRRGLRG